MWGEPDLLQGVLSGPQDGLSPGRGTSPSPAFEQLRTTVCHVLTQLHQQLSNVLVLGLLYPLKIMKVRPPEACVYIDNTDQYLSRQKTEKATNVYNA